MLTSNRTRTFAFLLAGGLIGTAACVPGVSTPTPAAPIGAKPAATTITGAAPGGAYPGQAGTGAGTEPVVEQLGGAYPAAPNTPTVGPSPTPQIIKPQSYPAPGTPGAKP